MIKNKKDKPLLSIVTIVYNGSEFLERTIKSVLNQTYDNIQYVIVDGASSDDTVSIIQKYDDRIDNWISEPDNGISDAFNKGISMCKGEYVGIINAGDWYEPDACEILIVNLDRNHDLYCGNLAFYEEDLSYIKMKKSYPFLLTFGMYVMHPTVFVKRTVYDNFKFDITLKIAMDYDFMLYCRNCNFKFKHINKIIADMVTGGVSGNIENMRIEEKMVQKRRLSSLDYLIARLKLIVELFYMSLIKSNKKGSYNETC